MSFKKKNSIYILAFVIVLIGGFIYKFFCKGIIDFRNKDSAVTASTHTSDNNDIETSYETSTTTSNIRRTFRVYICGQVNSPGVYEVEEGMLLCDVVDMSDGFTDEAPIENINLVYEIKENTSIYIPSVDELESIDTNNDLIRSDIIFVWGNSNSESSTGGSEQSDSKLININTASKDELMTLPGIGDKYASAIISYREDNVFEQIEDLKNVPGIGDTRFQKIEQYICVN